MAGLGVGLAFLGYWALYYGVSQVQGWNYGFFDLGIPSRWNTAKDLPRDPEASARGEGKLPPQFAPKGVPKKIAKSPAVGPRPSPGKG